MPLQFRLGNWKIFLHGLGPDANHLIEQFREHFGVGPFLAKRYGDVERCLIVTCLSVPHPRPAPAWLPAEVQPYWAEFLEEWARTYRYLDSPALLDVLPEVRPKRTFLFSWTPHRNPMHETTLSETTPRMEFYGLLIKEPNDNSYLKIFSYNLFLATQWYVERGGLIFHSSAIAYGTKGFLFIGQSQIGKSTIAQLSSSAGHAVLGDDLNFVIGKPDHDYELIAAVSPKISSADYSELRPPLRAVFTLVQDQRDFLVPLTQTEMARALFESLNQTPVGRKLSDELLGVAFRTICDIVRTIPGYELHFRKSPDFWDVIDAEIER